MNNEQRQREALREWIARKNGNLSAQDITDQRGIFSERLLKSIHITELILFIEELKGCPVSDTELHPGVFSNIDAMMANFFAEARE